MDMLIKPYPAVKYWNNCPFCQDIKYCWYCTDPLLDPMTKLENVWYEREQQKNRTYLFTNKKKPRVEKDLKQFMKNGKDK